MSKNLPVRFSYPLLHVVLFSSDCFPGPAPVFQWFVFPFCLFHSVVSPAPSRGCIHLSDCEWTGLLERGRGAGHPFFLQRTLYFALRSMSLLKHMASITGPLFPVSASFLLPTPCALWLLSLWAAEIQHLLHGPELMPPVLTPRGYEPSK